MLLALATVLLTTAAPGRADDVIVNDVRSGEVRFLEREIALAANDGRWSVAVEKIQRLVEAAPDEVASQAGGDLPSALRYMGVRRRGIALLANLPAEGLEAYESRYGAEARALAARGGAADLARVLATYLFTRAAEDVAHLLASRALERGDAERGAYWLEQLETKQPLERFRPATLALLALCYRASAQLAPLQRLVQAVPPGATARIGGVETSLAAYVTGLARTLAGELERPRNLDEWPYPGGDASQSRFAPFEVAAKERRWTGSLPQPSGRHVTSFTYARESTLRYLGGHTPSRVVPVVGGGLLYASNGAQVYAFNLYSGELEWTSSTPGPLTTPQDLLNSYTVTYHDGAVYAALEHSPGDYGVVLNLNGGRFQQSAPIPRRALVKLDPTDGKRVWTTVREAEGPTALVNRVNLLSAPVLRGGIAYVPGIVYDGLFRYFLFAFDASNGDLVWHRSLGSGQQTLNLFGRAYREIPGTMPSLHGGLIYVTSNLGFIACVEAEQGTVRWVARYPRVSFKVTQNLYLPDIEVAWTSRPPVVADGFVLCTPIDSPHLLCLRTDTGQLAWHKHHDQQRGRDHVLLGVVKGRVYTAGQAIKRYKLDTGAPLGARDLGQEVVGLGALSEHSGYVATWAGNAGGKLVRFNLEDLSIADSVPLLPEHVGVVLLAGNTLVLVGGDGVPNGGYYGNGRDALGVAVCYDWEEMQRNLRKRIDEDPRAPFAYNGLAAIQRQRGDVDAALASYKQALERAADSGDPDYRAAAARARSGLYAIHLRRATEHLEAGRHDAARAALVQARTYARGAGQLVRVLMDSLALAEAAGSVERMRAIVLEIERDAPGREVSVDHYHHVSASLAARVRLALALTQAKRGDEAVAEFQRILARHAKDGHPLTRALEALLGSAQASWLEGSQLGRAAIDALVRRHGPAVYARWEAEAAARLASARRTGSTGELELLLREYPNASVAREAAEVLVRLLVRADTDQTEQTRARALLAELLQSERDPARQAMLRYWQFLAYDADRMYQSAKQLLHLLAEAHAGARIEGDPTVDVDAFVQEQLARPEYKDVAAIATQPDFTLPHAPEPAWDQELERSTLLFRLATPRGDVPAAGRDRCFAIDQARVECRDASTGRRIWERTIGTNVLDLCWSGERLLAWTTDGDVVVLGLDQGDELWRSRLGWKICFGTAVRGRLLVVGDAASGASAKAALVEVGGGGTGQVRWQRDLPMSYPSGPIVAQRCAVVWDGTRDVNRIALVDLISGELAEPLSLAPGALTSVSPTLVGGAEMLVCPLGERQLALVDLVSGKVVRTLDFPTAIRGLVAGETRFFVDFVDGTVEGFGRTGERVWQRALEPGGQAQDRFTDQDHVYVVCQKQQFHAGVGQPQPVLVALDQASGEIRWRVGVDELPVTLSFTQRYVIVHISVQDERLREESRVEIIGFDRSGGKREWQIQVPRTAGTRVTAALTTDRLVVATARDRIKGYGQGLQGLPPKGER